LRGRLLRYAHLSNHTDTRLPTDFKAQLRGVNPEEIGEWIKQNTDRHNILLDASCGREPLTRLEEMALARLKPVFAGRMKCKAANTVPVARSGVPSLHGFPRLAKDASLGTGYRLDR